MDVDYHLICQGRSWAVARKDRALRKSKLEAAQTREAIVAAAADLIRRTGIAEASLADMMAAAGLTHGGFYRHFRNKEHLVSQALSAAGEKAIATIGRNMAKGGLNAAVDGYLSTPTAIPRRPSVPSPPWGANWPGPGRRRRPRRRRSSRSSLSRSPATRRTARKRAATPSSPSPR